MASLSLPGAIDPSKFAGIADCLMVAVAASLPWSTSVTSILLVLWLLALAPTLTLEDLRHELMPSAGGLPVLLFLLGALGMTWADVSWLERWQGLDSFFKLLCIPLLLIQFRRSERGPLVFMVYLVACIVLLVVSTAMQFIPALAPIVPGTLPVKNAATQSGEFITCIFGSLFFLIDCFAHRRWLKAIGMLAVIAGMTANILYLAAGRTAFVVAAVLLILLSAKRLSARGTMFLFACVILVCAAGWFSSSYLRQRTIDIWTDFQKYEATDDKNSMGERLEFWKKSLQFVSEAPIVGHGTGSIHGLFRASAEGQQGATGSATTNPHNQTFAVAIQLGLIGVVVLWAMWVAHLLLFRGEGLMAWIGLVVVVQNIVGSLFNSHLFDFTQGWTYVVGAGVAGGTALKERSRIPDPAA
jgi:O-antigen ligase